MKDTRTGKPLRNVNRGKPFAVKLVDFMADQPGKDGPPTQEKRESYEMEKHIMTFANHPNITPIRMAINMGAPQIFNYHLIHKWDIPKSGLTYVQHERVYLIMDLAEHGSLEEYLRKGPIQPSEQIKLVRDCFDGMSIHFESPCQFFSFVHLIISFRFAISSW